MLYTIVYDYVRVLFFFFFLYYCLLYLYRSMPAVVAKDIALLAALITLAIRIFVGTYA